RYSAGDPLDGMRERVQYAFDDLQRHQDAFPDDTFKLWEPDAYYFVMLLFSWIVLFNVPDMVKTLAASISRDPDDGWDPFIQVLFATFGVTDFPGAKAELLHPKPYGILYEALPKDRAGRQNGIQAYLKSWYKSKSIRGCYWHNRHKAELHPENHLGYWAFETGMLTVLDRLDDSAYRNLNFYPRDLVDYCREQGWDKELLETLKALREKPARRD
ncbi:MAG: DUF1911 domain-containing protein, partial [Desulfovibrio sp.]|nr:DUF1911 domain-containing protein [Desulfovibrio sp.]